MTRDPSVPPEPNTAASIDAELAALIETLRHAPVGTHGLDEAVHEAIGSPGSDDPRYYSFLHGDYPPPYTTSLDAGLLLVPEGWEWLTRGNARPFANVMTGAQPVVGEGFTQPDDSYTAYAATAALALCVAALLARAVASRSHTATGDDARGLSAEPESSADRAATS